MFRYVIIVTVTFALSSNVGLLVHYGTERHVTCPEHGESVHVGELPDEWQLVETGETKAGNTFPDSIPTHGHGHCGVCPSSREELSLNGPSASNDALVPAAACSPSEMTDTFASSCLYRLAPKNSPPT